MHYSPLPSQYELPGLCSTACIVPIQLAMVARSPTKKFQADRVDQMQKDNKGAIRCAVTLPFLSAWRPNRAGSATTGSIP
jgi:hypothetical protein